ncbi:LysR substrate-binding domain-containing protein [Alsobacter sp. KACC 23698]|uniref:LysR substrate-binding domain-containing protein n=1 Tax=Alsobacter sp. KACC 23698 TaxID=3149229 RepID=A0AAU7JCP9_9HYPH
MIRNLHLTALRAFEAATRTGSFRLAADDLGLSPSAVSHAIRGLERDLGTVLFEREGRSIRLTPEGETLMRHVARGFGELQLGIGSVAARKPQLFKLHCAPSFAAQWLVPRLKRLLAECPGLELRLATGTDYTRFLADEFDADIVYGVPSAEHYGRLLQQGVIVVPLGTETVTPVCAPSLAREIRTPADLMKLTLIESDNKKVRWPAWFAANGLVAPVPNGPRFDRSFMSLSAAADEIGVALESTLLAERELASGRLVRPLQGLCEDVVYTGHWIVFPRAKRYARSMAMVLEWLARELSLDLDIAALDEGYVRKAAAPVQASLATGE